MKQFFKFILAVTLVTVLTGCATTSPPGTVLEWAQFKLSPGVTDAQVLEASDAVQREFLSTQKGFIRRELLNGKDGQWSDLIYWESQAAADLAAKNVEKSGACNAYFQCMTEVSHGAVNAGVLHFNRVKTYPR